MTACFGIINRALPRQLVTFLAMLAPALAIALARNHRAASAFTADVAGCQAEINHGSAILDAFRLMLNATGVQGNRALSFSEPVRGTTCVDVEVVTPVS